MYNDLLLDRLVASQIALEDTPHDDDTDARIQLLIDEIEELESLLSPQAQHLIRDLRPRTVTDDVYEEIDEAATFGQRMADRIAAWAGSWAFILFFLVFMGSWMGLNLALGERAFDTFPFILLNLGLSTLAALQAPVILMSQNRAAVKDRAVARNDYEVNLKNELEIVDLHRKMDMLNNTLLMQNKLINALVAARRQELSATVRAIESSRNNTIQPEA